EFQGGVGVQGLAPLGRFANRPYTVSVGAHGSAPVGRFANRPYTVSVGAHGSAPVGRFANHPSIDQGGGMRQREFGKTGIMVSEVGLGAWQLDNQLWGGPDEQLSLRIVQEALDL